MLTLRKRIGSPELLGIAGLAGLASTTWLVAWAVSGRPGLWPPLGDDAHYYLEIARHVAAGDGLTFDGISTTNGFQPLWLALLVPVLALAGDNDTAALAALAAMALGLTVAVVAVGARLLRTALPWPAVGLALALLAFPRILEPLTSGMEAPLALLLALVIAGRLIEGAGDPEPPPSPWVTGALLSALILTRLDAVFLLVPLAVCAARAPAERRRREFTVLAAPVLVSGAYAAWCWARFGSPIPISGRLKSSLPDLGPWWSSILEHPDWLAICAVGTLGLALDRRWTQAETGQRRNLRRVGGLFMTAAGLHLAWTLWCVDWAVENWHFTTYLVRPLIGWALLADRLLGRLPRFGWTVVAAAVALNVTLSALMLPHATDFVDASREVAAWIDTHTPRDAVVATRDAGALGFASSRPVVNLDGVVNDEHFAEEVCAGRLTEYLEEIGVTHLVAIVDRDAVNPGYGSLSLPYDCHLGRRRPTAWVDVHESDELYATRPLAIDRETLRHLPTDDRIIVWRLPE